MFESQIDLKNNVHNNKVMVTKSEMLKILQNLNAENLYKPKYYKVNKQIPTYITYLTADSQAGKEKIGYYIDVYDKEEELLENLFGSKKILDISDEQEIQAVIE